MQRNAHLTLRLVSLLAAAAAAHASGPLFNAPGAASISTCDGGSYSASTLTGAVTNGGQGISLSGSVNLSYSEENYCLYTVTWQGTGSGSFSGANGTVSTNFTLTPPSEVMDVAGFSVTYYINGVQVAQNTCGSLDEELGAAISPKAFKPRGGVISPCDESFSNGPASITLPANFSSYEVVLTLNTFWQNFTDSSLNVNIPAGTSFDITTIVATISSAPALSPIALLLTGLLIVVAAYQRIYRLKS